MASTAVELMRRRMMGARSASIDWESIARGMVDNITEFELTDLPVSISANNQYSGRKGLKAVKIQGITNIGQAEFSGCSALESVEFPSNLDTIQYLAFGGCNLKTLSLPSSVTTIGQYAFNNNRSLQYIICEATTPPTISSGTFNNTNSCPIYVPDARVNDYKTANIWSDLASRIFPISDLTT